MLPMRRTPLPALFVLLALVAGGCGTDEKKDPPFKPGGDATTSTPTPRGSASASPEPQAFDDEGDDAVRGEVEADGPEDEAVADAWFAYWDVRTDSYFKARVDPRLGTVAAGDAVAEVVRYVTYLQGKKLHTVGDTKFGVTDIEVSKDTATLKSCGVNKSVDRTADGTPAEALTPFYNFDGGLTRVGGRWRVVRAEVVGNNGCRA
jgi:hypothetical protein